MEARAPERTETRSGLSGSPKRLPVMRRRDREARRHRQAEIGHLGEPRALAAEEVAHLGAAFGLAVAEAIDPLRLLPRGGARARGALLRAGFAARQRRGLTGRRGAGGFLLWASMARCRLGHEITNSNAQGPRNRGRPRCQ
jgi:hypothetical protein